MFSHYRRPTPLAWICFLATFATLIALGTWQVERLQWKHGLLAEVEAGKTHPLAGLPVDDEAPLFHRVTVEGRFGTQEFHVTPRYYKEQMGYHLFTPFTLTDGRIVMVNRGWVPAAQKQVEDRPGSEAPKGEVRLTALVREGLERTAFTPDSNPASNVWFGRDIERMAAYAKLGEILPYTLDIVGEQKDDVLPVPSDGNVTLRNDHLEYAITWYGIALGALIIFAVFHRKEKGEA